ncbi:hypothetical protein [Komagataeibacter sp. SM21]|uniref:hypothetical protein n=1 Tax=Komagataeibacter sp. SM21 TaxID=3242899 RepID=UPI003528432D
MSAAAIAECGSLHTKPIITVDDWLHIEGNMTENKAQNPSKENNTYLKNIPTSKIEEIISQALSSITGTEVCCSINDIKYTNCDFRDPLYKWKPEYINASIEISSKIVDQSE